MTGGGAMYTPPEYGYGSAQRSRQPEAQRMRDSGPLLIVRPPKDRTPHVCGSVEPSLAPSCRGVAYGVPRARSQRHSTKSLERPRGPYGMHCRVEISALWNARADSLSRRYEICVNYFDVCADIKSALASGQIWYRTYGIVRPSHPRTVGLWITRRSRRHMVERCNWEGDGRSPP